MRNENTTLLRRIRINSKKEARLPNCLQIYTEIMECSNFNRIQNKLKLLFSKIVEPDYVMNNYYADSLINKISNSSDPEVSEIGNMPLISDLIVDSLNHIENVDTTVKVFVIRTLGIIATKELHFSKIFYKQGDKILKGFKEINSPSMSASVRVAYMEVALGIAKHNSGITWLLETGVWKEILSLCNEKRTVFVVRQTFEFASLFLWRLNDLCDLPNIRTVLAFVLQPLIQVDLLSIESLSSEEEAELAKTIDPALHILIAILGTSNRIEKYTILINYLVKEYQVNTHLYVMFDRLHREETVLLLSKLIFWFVFSKMFLSKPVEPDVRFVMDDFLEISVTYFNIINFLVLRRNATLTLDFCTACNMIAWSICKSKEIIVWELENKQIVLRNRMLFMCLVPLLVFVKMGKTETGDKGLEEFTGRLLKATCEHTARAAYALRSLLEESDTMQIILQSVKKLSCLKNHLNNEQANLVFQALYYVLREYDPIDDFGMAKQEDGVQQYENNQDKVLVMTYVIDTVLCLLKNHNINWRESLEVICLYTTVYNILQRPNLTTKFVVASLNVIAMTVKKFLPPNLSLLLESKPGTSMDELGKLIYLKMHDLSWEVRDSALELLLVCTEISFIKFPPFQKQVLDNNLINVAAAVAFNDYESYVQVSALKCIGAASKISPIWEQLNSNCPNIQDHLLLALCNNQEGIVRKEACNVLTELYQNLKLSPVFKQNLYEHMVSSALSDFHWEVQIAALKFWRIVLQSLLTDQGMLDGTFPPVTFSRETRKIVTLNEAEIQRRLVKTLEELSSVGLLTVLIKLLHDDTEADVLECALSLSNELIDILTKYKVPECLKPRPGETVEDIACHIKDEKDDSEMVAESFVDLDTSDNVIEGILNVADINLLANIYERHMTLQSVKKEEPSLPKIKLVKVASPYAYVQFMKDKDFKAVVNEKRKWNDGIRSLSSLLDDVLGIYEHNTEVNSLDCY